MMGSYQQARPRRFGFEHALVALKNGRQVAREGWNGKGMFLVLNRQGTTVAVLLDSLPLQAGVEGGRVLQAQTPPFIAMFTAQGTLVPWLASVTDLLAEDWVEVDHMGRQI